ncbi:MAG TPA: FKBP-type peptidyl-prolyl cis-trans isomerase [Saprospiraceae bacterium]|nr:FKBP-type peptidyl-prolyl cis-trans isomerase [Saprospiraceae bacterium]
MKGSSLGILFFIIGSLSFTTRSAAQSNYKMDSLSYSIGLLFGNSLKQQGIEKISAPDVVEALEEFMSGAKTKISMQEASEIYSQALSKMAEKANSGVKEEGEKFLAENGKRKGVITTASGLQYEVIKMGEGPKPKATDKVNTHYHGTLINGKVFDSSVLRNEPISFPLNQVIKGWTEGLQLMPVGSKFKFFIPYSLAYGEKGAGADIKPFAALIFEVELLGIEQ